MTEGYFPACILAPWLLHCYLISFLVLMLICTVLVFSLVMWQPTPVFLPGESQGWGSLVGCRPWGCTESDTAEVT